jgi:hypothetical protein
MNILTFILTLLIATSSYAGVNLDLTYYDTKRLEVGTVIHHNPRVDWATKSYANLDGEVTNPMKEGWSIITTPLWEVEDALGIKILEQVVIMCNRYPNKQIVVIDWGCGMGQSINSVAEQSKRLGLNARFIGFSNLYFPQWSMTRNVEYIFDDMKNLPKYFNKAEIGLIYSHFGLYHISGEGISNHVNEMAPYMLTGGMIVTNSSRTIHKSIMDSAPYYSIDRWFTDHNTVYAETKTTETVYRLTRNDASSPIGSSMFGSAIPLNNTTRGNHANER